MLTRKQHELLTFIHNYLVKNGVSPSFDEMKLALGLKSKSGIHRLITGLEERGFLRRLPHRARALEVVRLPGNVSQPADGAPMAALHPPGRGNDNGTSPSNDAGSENVALPLYGRIAAGTPIEALRDESNQIDVPASLLGNGEYYALEIAGDSMIEAGIFDGDIVIIERCDTAPNGTIVVALVDGQEATLKRLRKKGNSIALEAANPAYETRIFGPDRVTVQGRLVTLIRQYH